MTARNLFADIKSLESRLLLPKGFYRHLLDEDDWSFVIKLNALFEAACTHALVARLVAPALTDPLANLDHANTKSGKVVMLQSLGAITADQSGILQRLAELRNRLVHNVSNVGFAFNEHVASMDKNQSKAFVKVFGHGISDSVPAKGKTVSRAEFVLHNPKLAIWLTAAEVLAYLYLEFELAELSRRSTELEGYEKLAGRFGR